MSDAEKSREIAELFWLNSSAKAKLATFIRHELTTARRAGAEAMRERAAQVADADDGKAAGGNLDYGPNVRTRIAAAIRALEIEG